MERALIVEHVRRGRSGFLLTFALLIIAFMENNFLNCWRIYSFPSCELGWIYIVLALIMAGVAWTYRK